MQCSCHVQKTLSHASLLLLSLSGNLSVSSLTVTPSPVCRVVLCMYQLGLCTPGSLILGIFTGCGSPSAT